MVSIIVPVYNTALYLDDCIQSLVNQTYKDLDIILVDDGSKDESRDILKRWAAKDQRIRVIFKEKNSGISESRNIGLKEAKGEYIGFVDSDDWVEPEMFAELCKQLEETGADVAFGGYNRIEEDCTVPIYVSEPTGTVLPVEDALLRIMPQRGEGRYNLYLWDKLFRKESVMKKEGYVLFDTAISFCEDVLWLIQVLLNCKTVTFWQGCGYNYRTTRIGNTWMAFTNYNNLKYCECAVKTNQEIYDLLSAAGSNAANNQLQRVLYYRRFAVRTASKQKNKEAYRRYSNGYYLLLFKWYSKNRSIIGLKWLVRQIGGNALYQIKKFLPK